MLAACTSATISGEGASSVISQAAAASCIHVPMLETTSEVHSARNNGRRNGAQAAFGAAVTAWVSRSLTLNLNPLRARRPTPFGVGAPAGATPPKRGGSRGHASREL